MCVVTPKGTGPLAPTAGERGCRCQEKEAGTWRQRYVWLVVAGGGIGSPSRCGSLSGSHLPAPWIPQTQVLPPQPPLSSTHGDPQAILSPSGEDCCSQTLLPIWDTSRESTRQTWPCPQPRECLEGKEASPSPEDLRVLRLIPWELKEDQKQMKIASLTLTPSHGGNDSQHSHGALSGSGVF